MPTSERDWHAGIPDCPWLLEVPHYEQYFGMWAMLEDRMHGLASLAAGPELIAHVRAAAGETRTRDGVSYRVSDGIAVITISGPMMKFASSLEPGTSTVFTRQAIRAAARDEDVRAILLVIDSPGGTVAGTEDLAGEVWQARQRKPCYAFVEDLGASAAYWVASQAAKVYAANRTTLVGSIGTYGVIADFSGYAAQNGIKVHVVRAGAFKGSGEPGTEVTPEQLAEWQRLVDGLNAQFLAGVARGRKMSAEKVAELADGRVHQGPDAEQMGLIDGVKSYEEVLQEP